LKVILIQDVSKVGNKGDLVEVSDGYARNFLFKKGLAVEGIGGRLKEWEEQQRTKRGREVKLEKTAIDIKKRLGGKRVLIKMSSGGEGRLFGSVTSAHLASAVFEQYGVEIDKKDVRLEEQVKQLGIYPFKVKLHGGMDVELSLIVEAE
jgi:large subunit ribosomal protein L9